MLNVTPGSVAQRYAGKAADFQASGRKLGVETVLSGHITQHGDDLSIAMELGDVNHGRQLWGAHYSRKVTDLLMVQDDIAKEVSQRLRPALSLADRQRMISGSTTSPEAYALYLEGNCYANKYTRQGFRHRIP